MGIDSDFVVDKYIFMACEVSEDGKWPLKSIKQENFVQNPWVKKQIGKRKYIRNICLKT